MMGIIFESTRMVKSLSENEKKIKWRFETELKKYLKTVITLLYKFDLIFIFSYLICQYFMQFYMYNVVYITNRFA